MAPSEFAEMMASSAVSASARKVASAARRLPGLAVGRGDSRSVFDPDRESCGRTHVKDLISYLPVYAFAPSKRVISPVRPALRMSSICRAARAFLVLGAVIRPRLQRERSSRTRAASGGCGFGPRGAWPPKRTAPAPWVCNGLPGLRDYEKAWTWPRKLPPGDGRSVFDRLAGTVEVDETYLSRPEEGARGRQTEKKPLIVVAAQ